METEPSVFKLGTRPLGSSERGGLRMEADSQRPVVKTGRARGHWEARRGAERAAPSRGRDLRGYWLRAMVGVATHRGAGSLVEV